MLVSPVINDLRAIYELVPQGLELDLERARLSPHSPLAEAVASRLSFGGLGAETFVLYANSRKQRALGMVQARLRKNRPEADITFIAPTLESDPDAVATWYRLLAEVVNGLGELGCQRIYARIPGANGSEEVFRQAGFSIFAWEDIYVLPADMVAAKRGEAHKPLLRRQRKRDSWNILRLYSALTPRPVQQAEGMLSPEDTLGKLGDWWEPPSGSGYVYVQDGELLGVVRILRGRLASWMHLYLHPQTSAEADALVGEAIALASKTRPRTMYCSVRDYEGGIRAALEGAGFTSELRRALMVKHTTVRVKEAVPWLAPVMEKPVPVVQRSAQSREIERERELQAA